MTHLLYINDLKIFAASREKLRRAMAAVRGVMKDIGLDWNERKCSVAHVKRGMLEPEESESAGDSEREVFKSLAEGSHCKFLGVMENSTQDDDLSLQIAGKAYLQHLSLIWSSPLSDYNKVQASNQFPMPVLSYLVPSHCWPVEKQGRLSLRTEASTLLGLNPYYICLGCLEDVGSRALRESTSRLRARRL